MLLHDTDTARGWSELERQEIDAWERAWVAITSEPRSVQNPGRQHRLKATLGAVKVGGTEREQWQYEVTSGARIWYAIADEQRTLWATKAETGHPGITDRGKGGGRRSR
ncbi:hypothetical protein ACH474_00495 [Nocardia rhamnosiphila]|uniref:hypothetical protein n=1 Tax=Nocardia rhamnosiphila TaxID=426716 RepID=UPI00378C968D